MSLLSEYIELAKRGLPNIDKIMEGLWNETKSLYGSLPEDEQEEIIRRKLICRDCPLYSLNVLKDDSEYRRLYDKGHESERKGRFCTICGCPENTKTSSLSSDCGLTEYNKEHPENIQVLKWTKYK